jgi:phospholipase D1/2
MAWNSMGRRFRQRFFMEQQEQLEQGYGRAPHGSCRVQAVRSVSDWSHGVLTEHSIQNACEF